MDLYFAFFTKFLSIHVQCIYLFLITHVYIIFIVIAISTGASSKYTTSEYVVHPSGVEIGNVNCTGSEEKLSYCIINEWKVKICALFAGVVCTGKITQLFNRILSYFSLSLS